MKITRPRATRLSQVLIDCDLAMGAHNITLGAAQTVDGVDVSAIQTYIHDGTLVVNGGTDPSPNPPAWTDIDLSAYVGANRALVILKFFKPAGGSEELSIRPNGDTDQYWDPTMETAANAVDISGGEAAILICETDAAGIIEWYSEHAGIDIDIFLLGYIT